MQLEKYDGIIKTLYDYESQLLELKKEKFEKETEILLSDSIDYKEIYGRDNQKVRDNYMKNQLIDLYDKIDALELEIKYNQRYLKYMELIHNE